MGGDTVDLKELKILKPPFPPLPKGFLLKDAPPILEIIYHSVSALNYQLSAIDQQINALDSLFKVADKVLATGGDVQKLMSPPPSEFMAKKVSEVSSVAATLEKILTEFIKTPSEALISQIEEIRNSINNRTIKAYLNAIVDAYREGAVEEARALASGVRRALRALENKGGVE